MANDGWNDCGGQGLDMIFFGVTGVTAGKVIQPALCFIHLKFYPKYSKITMEQIHQC